MSDDTTTSFDRRVLRRRLRSESARLAALGAAAVAVLAVLVFQLEDRRLTVDDDRELTPLPPLEFAPLPDFAALRDVKTRKARFFAYLRPMIDARNARIRRIRAFLVEVRERVSGGRALDSKARARIDALAVRYRIELPEAGEVELAQIDELLTRADVLPPSLVLAQAATESAWGTSRFARTANNLFGEWCYTPGCGVVPSRRRADAKHEVEAFDDVYASVDSYFRNLNSNDVYAEVRARRASARARGAPITGVDLAQGLAHYSERRGAYVEEIRNMIRVNDLARFDAELAGAPSSSSAL